MKTSFLATLCLLLLAACQQAPKQYFTSSPEIDLAKKGNDAYFKGDWETLRSVYADTARIWDNTWDPAASLTVDQNIEGIKASLADYTEYKMDQNPVYEMVVTDEGQKWVHCWFVWRGKHKSGKEAASPVNLSFLVVDNKVAWQVNIYNQLPGHLAAEADSTEAQ